MTLEQTSPPAIIVMAWRVPVHSYRSCCNWHKESDKIMTFTTRSNRGSASDIFGPHVQLNAAIVAGCNHCHRLAEKVVPGETVPEKTFLGETVPEKVVRE